MEAGEVAAWSFVVAGGDASPGLQLVDQPFDSVPFLVEVGVVTYGPAASGALLLAVGGLVPFLRDDGLDSTFAQVGAVAAGRVRLIRGDRPGRRAGTADRQTDPHLREHGDELRAVPGLPDGQDQRERTTPAVRGEMNLAREPAPEPAEQGFLQTEPVSAPDAPPFVLSVLFLRAAPFCRAVSCSCTASSRAFMRCLLTRIPAAS